MKKMSCRQLGGACDEEFFAATFDQMAEKSRQHGMEMFQNGDVPHTEAMNKMKELMQKPGEMQEWMEAKRKEFESSPDVEV